MCDTESTSRCSFQAVTFAAVISELGQISLKHQFQSVKKPGYSKAGLAKLLLLINPSLNLGVFCSHFM